jgi:hypothetical protein
VRGAGKGSACTALVVLHLRVGGTVVRGTSVAVTVGTVTASAVLPRNAGGCPHWCHRRLLTDARVRVRARAKGRCRRIEEQTSGQGIDEVLDARYDGGQTTQVGLPKGKATAASCTGWSCPPTFPNGLALCPPECGLTALDGIQ